MKTSYMAIALLTLGISGISAQERAVLTAPVARPAIASIEVMEVRVARLPDWSIVIIYTDNAGTRQVDQHNGVFVAPVADNPATPEVNEFVEGNPNGADVLVKAFNKANFGAKSLECRALEHLRDEGKIAAFTACSGRPQ